MSDEEASMLSIGDVNTYETFINVPGLQLNAINYAPVDVADFNKDKMTVAQFD